MRTTGLGPLLLLLLPVAWLAACGGAPPAELAVESPRAFAPPGSGSGAVYFTVVNTTGADDRLLAVTSPAAERAELHAMVEHDGMMRMEPFQDGMPVPAGERTELAPGGRHVMLMGLTGPLAVGDTVELTLRFETAGERTLSATVVADPETAAGEAG